MTFIDNTGKPISKEDIEEAMGVVSKFLVTGILTLPPEFAVQLGNIHRCLKELRESKEKKPEAEAHPMLEWAEMMREHYYKMPGLKLEELPEPPGGRPK